MTRCSDCEALRGAGRKTPPHPNLKKTGEFRQIGGSSQANEQDYVCIVCGTNWMHETGNSGYGWM